MQTLASDISFVKTQNGTFAAQTDVLLLRTNELKNLFPQQTKAIENLGIKIRRAKEVSNTVFETQKNITTLLKDSTINDTIKLKYFNYSDKWYKISSVSKNDSIELKIYNTDTLTQVVFKGERSKPWLWIFSPRKLQQRIIFSNPNSVIKYSQFIEIQKR